MKDRTLEKTIIFFEFIFMSYRSQKLRITQYSFSSINKDYFVRLTEGIREEVCTCEPPNSFLY